MKTYYALWTRYGEAVHASEQLGQAVHSLCGATGNAILEYRKFGESPKIKWCARCTGVVERREDPKWCASCGCNGNHPCSCAEKCSEHRPQQGGSHGSA